MSTALHRGVCDLLLPRRRAPIFRPSIAKFFPFHVIVFVGARSLWILVMDHFAQQFSPLAAASTNGLSGENGDGVLMDGERRQACISLRTCHCNAVGLNSSGFQPPRVPQ